MALQNKRCLACHLLSQLLGDGSWARAGRIKQFQWEWMEDGDGGHSGRHKHKKREVAQMILFTQRCCGACGVTARQHKNYHYYSNFLGRSLPSEESSREALALAGIGSSGERQRDMGAQQPQHTYLQKRKQTGRMMQHEAGVEVIQATISIDYIPFYLSARFGHFYVTLTFAYFC